MKRPARESSAEKGLWHGDGNGRPLDASRAARRAASLP